MAGVCVEVISRTNIPQEIDKHGGVAAYEAYIIERRSSSVQSIEDAQAIVSDPGEPDSYCEEPFIWDTGDSEFDTQMQSSDEEYCAGVEDLGDFHANFSASSIPVYRAAIDVYDQILDALECYADAS